MGVDTVVYVSTLSLRNQNMTKSEFISLFVQSHSIELSGSKPTIMYANELRFPVQSHNKHSL